METAGPRALVEWLDERRRACDMEVVPITWAASEQWIANGDRIAHRDGAFFEVAGRRIDRRPELDQPLIVQPEIGILGFVMRAGREPEVLVQAKPEPGNVGIVQLAPTVQATESNYLRRHGGRPTPLLELFTDAACPLSDSLQSEQGTRFDAKYNRNTVVELDTRGTDDIDETDGVALRWFPFSAVQPLLVSDYAVNTDARSVLATAPWHRLAAAGTPFGRWAGTGGFGEALLRSHRCDRGGTHTATERLTHLRAVPRRVHCVPLTELVGWQLTDDGLESPRSPLAVRPFAIRTTEREVDRWDQPLMAATGEEAAVMVVRLDHGVARLLFTASVEIGFREGVQWGPSGTAVPSEATPVASCVQSDEGGRFFRSRCRYTVTVIGDDRRRHDDSGDSVWLTLAEVEQLLPVPGTFTNEARTLISMLLAWL